MWIVLMFKQKTAYEMRIGDWSSDVCSSDLEGCSRQGDPLTQLRLWSGHAGPKSAQPSPDGRGENLSSRAAALGADLLRRIAQIVGGHDRQPRIGEDFLALVDIGAFEQENTRPRPKIGRTAGRDKVVQKGLH